MSKAVGFEREQREEKDGNFRFNTGLAVDFDGILEWIESFKKSTDIKFVMSNDTVYNMLKMENIENFKKLCKEHSEVSIDISKKRTKHRKVSIVGENAYGVYKDLKALEYSLAV